MQPVRLLDRLLCHSRALALLSLKVAKLTRARNMAGVSLRRDMRCRGLMLGLLAVCFAMGAGKSANALLGSKCALVRAGGMGTIGSWDFHCPAAHLSVQLHFFLHTPALCHLAATGSPTSPFPSCPPCPFTLLTVAQTQPSGEDGK